jgi:hypothetical protein
MSTDGKWDGLSSGIGGFTLEPAWDLHWQMTRCERFALVGLLQRLRPELSLEIGTYRGGSLQALSYYSQKVISIDIDPGVADRLKARFSNVEFRSGDSRSLLPQTIAEINRGTDRVGFVLVDGDHSAEGVRRDIESVLRLVPQKRLVVILHDSFNPECRAGMRLANWSQSPYVHEVELDFIPGVYHQVAYDTAEARSMWGGFACAILEPQQRTGRLEVKESQKGLYDAVFLVSAHFQRWARLHTMARRAKSAIAPLVRRVLRPNK